ncbi:MAG: PQQ-dependent sugar dehydrogenase, partial [Acidobacteriaceae bacterium]|nr:PQQ-dependent sugar dehydrogenase [Acidobacteriaceae bacterium]
MKELVLAGVSLALAASHAMGQINAGDQKPEPSVPFNMVQVTTL